MDRRPSRPSGPAVGPLAPQQLALPSEQGRWSDHEGDPTVARDHPTRGCEEDPVDDPEPGWASLPLEDLELMAEDQDLEVLGAVISASGDEEPSERSDDEVRKVNIGASYRATSS